MWRDAEAVVVQPPGQPGRHYCSSAEAIEAMSRDPRVVVTNINARQWPAEPVNKPSVPRACIEATRKAWSGLIWDRTGFGTIEAAATRI
jgi:hypothetical protein